MTAAELELFIEKLALPGPRRRHLRVRRQPAARGRPDVYAELVTELRELGVDRRDRHRGRADARRRCAPSPPSSPRTSARPRRSSATSSATPRTSPRARRGLLELGAGEAIITRETAASRIVGEGAGPAPPTRSRTEPLEPVSTVGSGDASSPATSPPATRALARASASPTPSPAAPSRPSTSAPARSTARRSSGCSTAVEVARARDPRRRSASALADSRAARQLTAVILSWAVAMTAFEQRRKQRSCTQTPARRGLFVRRNDHR